MDYLKKTTTTLCKHSQSHNHIESYSEENSNEIKTVIFILTMIICTFYQ